MPVFRQRMVTEVARGMKAFFSVEVGITRGEVPEGFQEAAPSNNQPARIEKLRKRLNDEIRKAQDFRAWRMDANKEIIRLHALDLQRINERHQSFSMPISGDAAHLYLDSVKRMLKDYAYETVRPTQDTGWPAVSHTMVTFENLDVLQRCIESVIKDGVEGDLIETGVWRGGASIFMRAVLKAYGVTDRTVWVADSFEGLPPPDAEKYPEDAMEQTADLHAVEELAVPLEEVQSNFERYGLLDDQVRFLKGWFSDTLPDAPVEKLAVARLDGDMYESTMDALSNLYPKLSVGGYLIVDDYGDVHACRKAVHDYREANDIDEEIHSIDLRSVFWQRAK